jgi:antitoxin component YwqK of YwqJK toxin-antitoxin module
MSPPSRAWPRVPGLAPFRALALCASSALFALSACQQVEVAERSPAGQVMREDLYRPWGPRDSLHRIGVRTYFFNGHRESETALRSGLKHGKAREYWHNGHLKSEGRYRDGLRQGTWKFYWNRYQPSSQGEYRDGLRQGPWFEYFESGDLRRRGSYADDAEIGLWQTYSQRGDTLLLNSCFAHNDTGSYRSFHAGGGLDESYACLRGKPFGPYVRYARDGELSLTGQYDSLGRRTGPWLGYHSNGQVSSRQGYLGGLWLDSLFGYDSLGRLTQRGHFNLGTGILQTLAPAGTDLAAGDSAGLKSARHVLETIPYVSGRREGEMLAFYPDGALQARYIYANDTLRRLERYHPAHTQAIRLPPLAQIGHFVGGQRDSLWIRYHPNGKVAESAHYVGGVLHGEQAFFDLEGKVTQRIRYEHGYPAEGRFRGVPGIKPGSDKKTLQTPD